MREAELWDRMTHQLGSGYVRTWAEQTALPQLGSRTVVEALADGVPYKVIWRAVWEQLDLPPRER